MRDWTHVVRARLSAIGAEADAVVIERAPRPDLRRRA
jgi:hypothetical protein